MRPGDAWRIGAALALIAMVLLAAGLSGLGRAIALLVLGVSPISALAYLLDKRAAIAGTWRISEATLHGIDLAGGSVGGLLAQVAFRHKTAKLEFAVATARIAILQLCAMAAVIALALELPPA